MMKWARRKSSSPSSSSSSSRPSFISHVSPLSWLSMFKNMGINSDPVSARLKQKGTTKQNSLLAVSSPPQYKSCENGGDDEAFWRLSFGEESQEDKKSRDILMKSEVSLDNGGRWNAKKYEGRREGITSKFKESKRDFGDERKSPNRMKMDDCNREKELEMLRRRFERKSQKVLQEKVLRLEREAENATPTTIWTPRRHSFNTQRFQKQQCEEFKKRQSFLVSREIQRRKPKQSSKVRIYSPRMSSKVEICKIKALEDMRKAKLKMKKAKEGLDSFAVVKCSMDPQKDFRDSMVEMIREKQIRQPQEMEELLACYLTLNSDEYHDLIIKVFRQVWFDMNIVWELN